jgi:hypothetical protein
LVLWLLTFGSFLLFGLAKARLKISQRLSLNLLSTTHPPPTTTQTFEALPSNLQSYFLECSIPSLNMKGKK